jgi:hypothetical protein
MPVNHLLQEEVNTKAPFLFLQKIGFHFLWAIVPPFAFKGAESQYFGGENQNGRIVKKEMEPGGYFK